MAACQVYHVDVVTYAGSVRCIVVIAEYTEAFQFADRYLCYIRKQVVRDTFRIFSDHAALVCTDRVEVTKQDHVPFRICFLDIGQDLFQHPFCPAVWVGAGALRAFFCDRDHCRITVYGCG